MNVGFERLYTFHPLRHTAVINLYRASRGPVSCAEVRKAREPLTTTVYTHPSDQEMGEISGHVSRKAHGPVPTASSLLAPRINRRIGFSPLHPACPIAQGALSSSLAFRAGSVPPVRPLEDPGSPAPVAQSRPMAERTCIGSVWQWKAVSGGDFFNQDIAVEDQLTRGKYI